MGQLGHTVYIGGLGIFDMTSNTESLIASTHLFGQIVIDDQGVFTIVSEVLSHGTA